MAPLTLQRFRDLGFQFSQKVFGLKEKTPRWKACTSNVNANFGMALSYIYAQKYFNDQAREKVGNSASLGSLVVLWILHTKSSSVWIETHISHLPLNPQALEMLMDIKATFDEMVAELDWMDTGTRARAHKKLQAMRPFVGIPEWITNSEKLDKFYEGVSYLSPLSHDVSPNIERGIMPDRFTIDRGPPRKIIRHVCELDQPGD